MTALRAVRAAGAFLVGLWLVLSLAADPLGARVSAESVLLDRVNVTRRSHRLIGFVASDALSRVARAHAEEMAREGYVSHVNPAGQNPLDRVTAAGVSGFRLLAENIGASSIHGDRVSAIFDGWLRSESHRENILNPAFNTSGVAVVEAPDGRTIIVQLFATF